MYLEKGFTREDLWDIRNILNKISLTEDESLLLEKYYYDNITIIEFRNTYNFKSQRFIKTNESLLLKIKEYFTN